MNKESLSKSKKIEYLGLVFMIFGLVSMSYVMIDSSMVCVINRNDLPGFSEGFPDGEPDQEERMKYCQWEFDFMNSVGKTVVIYEAVP